MLGDRAQNSMLYRGSYSACLNTMAAALIPAAQEGMRQIFEVYAT
jgi:hypothetical protein